MPKKAKAPPAAAAAPAPGPKPRTPPDPERIEPGRKRRIARERDPIGGRLDLHGMTQDQARAVLHGFIERAHERGERAVLVITGKGYQGDGVLRRRVPEWLAEAPSRARVAGYSQAERHHGGEGALYVALKRRNP
jgi:DNA-nicking Smr family endonuclease